jgi:pimeloyl-ACP methyl ester carboxylesterase
MSATDEPPEREVYAPRRAAQREEISGREGRISLLRWGPAHPSPIVLLHGWMDCAAAWQLVVDHLPDDWPLLAIDWPGYGQSDRHSAHYWFPEHLSTNSGTDRRPQHGRHCGLDVCGRPPGTRRLAG